ncbi:MAG: cell division protein FtsZ [bacterium]
MGMFEIAPQEVPLAKIMVIGVGGAGGNTINTMIEEGVQGVNTVAVNTDLQDLRRSKASTKIQIGKEVTRGLGTGFDPAKGKKAVEEDQSEIQELVKEVDMIFITAGMGGGTGTGASPLIAEVAKKAGALTVCVVTLPFKWEGMKKMEIANRGLKELEACSDTILVIQNDNIKTLYNDQITLMDAFKYVDGVLVRATKGVSDLITKQGHINLDFADISRVMSKGGKALMGIGYGTGEDRAIQAANEAINSPLLENVSISEAVSVLINITGPRDLKLDEVYNTMNFMKEKVGGEGEKELLFGIRYDDTIDQRVEITIIATGIGTNLLRKTTQKSDQEQSVSESSVLDQAEQALNQGLVWDIDESSSTSDQYQRIEEIPDQKMENEKQDNNKKMKVFENRMRSRKNKPIDDDYEVFTADELMEPAYLRRQNN